MTERVPQGEGDVARDTGVARSRAYGGPPPDTGKASDAATTTGTVDHGLFVGRVAGDDLGYAGQTGAEARTRGEPDDPGPDDTELAHRQEESDAEP